ncbi:MAG: RelA/SpoT family protein [Anaerolineae bacterium]
MPSVTLQDILSLLPSGPQGTDARALVRRAYAFAEEAHQGQMRKSGDEPYIQHPLSVAYLLAEIPFEPAVIAAGLLHDVLEDNRSVTRQELREQFGQEVLTLVEGVTKLEDVEERVTGDRERDRDLRELESLRKMFIAMAEDDVRIIFIKLADRLHNMRTLEGLTPENQERMAQETLEIFAPLANRLGIWYWKAELEDLAFRCLNPKMYEELADLLAARKDERRARVKQHVEILEESLAREGISADIKGRPKHIYSIYRKMHRKQVPFEQIYDAEGHRIIVDTESECYRVLGIVHHLWTPVSGEFDDYIANPKPNGYQSLHTAVIAEDRRALEIQIRTHEMDYVAEYGVAAHWRYKERDTTVSMKMAEHIAQIRQSVQELTLDTQDARGFIDTVRTDVFEDRVYVFTPQGKVIDLPVGATPIDFAYYVHTEVGHRCRGARVNGEWTPLDYHLKTGDQVKIITGRKGGPSRDWLNEELGFVRTSRARQKVRQWFRKQSREENSAQGRTMVERELKRLSLDLELEEVASFFGKRYQHPDDFFAAVGVGDVQTERIVHRIEEVMRRRQLEEQVELAETGVETPPPPPKTSARVDIHGAGTLLTRIARCCNPLPGQEIVGYVTRGKGVTIHRSDCPNILRLDREERERVIELDWGLQEETFAVQVIITAYDRSRLLHDISGVMVNEDINMISVKTGKRDRYNIISIYITLEVPSLSKLNRVLRKIEQIRNVIEARRQT